MTYNYYATQRPAGPGAVPTKGLVNIIDFGGRTEIPSIGKAAYCLLQYNRLLDDKEMQDYELAPDIFLRMYMGSWYTITGCGGDLDEWKQGYQEMLDAEHIGVVMEWHDFTGLEMNNRYGLTGENRYPDDLHFLAFSLDGLDIGKLAIFKLTHRDRWFDDIVDNNQYREAHRA